ncbi:MAG: polysaccharide deacetylase family protein [Clostridia bacterium]|nr:polysaccharide deacetylase family protein [Clostridia bacterium]MBQ7907822.1 polysaccharide deacetylase family protein [Clostridia bacterium]
MNNKMLFKDGKPKALTFSYDDGEKQDIPLIQLFNKYGLKGTFNLNSGLMSEKVDEKSSKVALEQIPEVYKGHEVAVHSSTHPFLERLPETLLVKEIIDDKELLEKYTGYVVRGMAYPFGTYGPSVLRVIKDCGIKYSRGVGAHHKFTITESHKWLEMDTTCHQADEKIFDLAKSFVEDDPFARWSTIEGWLFYIWGHSYEYRTDEDWARMERLCQMLSGRDDIWYATNIEIYDYIEAYRGLEYSANGKIVFNPSAIDVWMSCQGENIKIPSRQTVMLK